MLVPGLTNPSPSISLIIYLLLATKEDTLVLQSLVRGSEGLQDNF